MKIKQLDDLISRIKLHFTEYLEMFDTQFTSSHFTCPNRMVHSNEDEKPSAAYYPNDYGFKCFSCFKGDAPVFTNNGLVNIEDIRIGDKVLSKDGNFYKVTNSFKKKYNGEFIELNATLPGTIDSTYYHNIDYVNKDCQSLYYRDYSINKKPANELEVGDYLVTPITNFQEFNKKQLVFDNINTNSRRKLKIDIDSDFCKFLGLFIAEGNTNDNRSVCLTFHKKEQELIKFVTNFAKRYELNATAHYKKESKACTVIICNTKLAKWLHLNCGHTSKNKKIPYEFLGLSEQYLQDIINAIILGDGHRKSARAEIVTTISRTLAHQLYLLGVKLHKYPSVSITKAHTSQSDGIFRQTVYHVCLREVGKSGNRLSHKKYKTGGFYLKTNEGEVYCKRIRKINTYKQDTYVYNITVEKTHNYNINGVTVANCEASGDIFTCAHFLEGKPLSGKEFITDNVLYLAEVFCEDYEIMEKTEEELKKEALYKALEDTCMLACKVLQSDSEKLNEVKKYINGRGWEDLVEEFDFGFCDYQKLIDILRKRGHTDATLRDVGLLPPENINKQYEKYLLENRLLFPIRNEYGKIVAFGSRLIRPPVNDKEQKYLQSRNTILYNKTNTLFNLDKARLSSKIYIVEGYADVFTLYKHGIENCVALCGLSFNEVKYKLLVKNSVQQILLCLDGKERIITNNGNIAIKDIKLGDKVLTHNGEFKEVIELIKNPLYNNLYEIENKLNCKPLKVTANHPILANEYPRFNWTKNKSLSTPNSHHPLKGTNNYNFEWVRADELSINHVLKVPFNTRIESIESIANNFVYKVRRGGKAFKITKRDKLGRIIKQEPIFTKETFKMNGLLNDSDFWKVIGLFLADGHAQIKTNRIEFAVHRNQGHIIDLIQKCFKKHNMPTGSIFKSKKQKCNVLYIYHNGLCKFFKECYNKNKEKTIPQDLMTADNVYQRNLIEGLFLGDGTIAKTLAHRFINTSYDLMLSLQLLLFRCDIVSSIKIALRKNQYINRNNKEAYSLSICKKNWSKLIKNSKYIHRSPSGSWIKDDYVYIPINNINVSENAPEFVYNLEVAENHSYISEKLISCHNCLDNDEAGRNALKRIIDKELKTLSGIDVYIKVFPDDCLHKDVDEYINEEGVEAFNNLKEVSVFDYKLNKLSQDRDDIIIKNDVIELIVMEDDFTRKEGMAKKLSAIIDVSVESINKEVTRTAKQGKGKQLTTSEDILEELNCFERIVNDWDRKIWDRKNALLGLSMNNFPMFTKETDGLQNMFYLIAADTNVGKSAMLLEMSMDLIESNEDVFVLYFSVDDALSQLIPRLVASDIDMHINTVSNPKFKIQYNDDLIDTKKDEMLLKRTEAINKLKARSDKFAIKGENEAKKMEDIEKFIRIYKKIAGTKQLVVIIDNIHRMSSYERMETRQLYMKISDSLKEWKNEFDIPILVTAELKKTEGRRPKGDDIKEVKDLQYDADLVALLYCDFYTNSNTLLKFDSKEIGIEDSTRARPVVEMNIIKNKTSGFKKRLYYQFYPEYSRFDECTKQQIDEFFKRYTNG